MRKDSSCALPDFSLFKSTDCAQNLCLEKDSQNNRNPYFIYTEAKIMSFIIHDTN